MSDLRDAISVFIEERDWQQFHSPKNLAMSLSVEVAEIVETSSGLAKNKVGICLPKNSPRSGKRSVM